MGGLNFAPPRLWEYLGFAANGLLFLLVGFTLNIGSLLTYGWPIAVGIGSVLVARLMLIGALTRRLLPQSLAVERRERLVLFWGGLRGALTMALALALPPDLPQHDLVAAMAFGVVLFTLVIQGLTLAVNPHSGARAAVAAPRHFQDAARYATPYRGWLGF
jgi:CPA1 family monovalent cation:H+ antiporter